MGWPEAEISDMVLEGPYPAEQSGGSMRHTRTSRGVLGATAGLIAVLGLALAASHAQAIQSGQRAQDQARQVSSAESWSQSLWAAASRGDKAAFTDLLGRAGDSVRDPLLADLANSLTQSLEAHKIKRQEKVDEHREKLSEALASYREATEPFDREKALADGLSAAISLHMLADDKAAVLQDRAVVDLTALAKAQALHAESQGRWYAAADLFERLHALYEDENTFLDDRTRQIKRLSLIALYAPERNHALRSARLVEAGEDPLPPYNPVGESVSERIEDIEPLMLMYAIFNADRHHVSGSNLKDLLVSGLRGLRLVAETTDLYDAYPQLADASRRTRFVEWLASKAADLERARIANENTLREVITEVQSWNRQTIGLPDALVLRVFGDGAMRALDEYTEIIWPYDVRQFERSTRGNFSGIGVSIQLNAQRRVEVVTPLDGTPAQRAGVRARDIIKAVNGEDISNISLNSTVDKITGPKGTPVVITVERGEGDNKQDIDFTIVRDTVELKTVKGWERIDGTEDNWNWMIDPVHGIGYVRLTGFNEATSGDFDKALGEMRKQGLQALVLDLRFNRGGLLDQAVEITSRFVDFTASRRAYGQVVVSTRNDRTDGNGMPAERLIRRDTPLPKLPVVVLINEGSASASEIVAGAIQDYARASAANAVVLGQTSYGKGSVQNVLPIDPDRRSAPRALMKLTTQYYVLPGGRMIHRVPGKPTHGVRPDMDVAMLPEQVAESLMLRQQADVLVLDEHGNPPPKDDRPDPSRLIDEGLDLQLHTALVLLQSQTKPSGAAAAMLPGKDANRTP